MCACRACVVSLVFGPSLASGEGRNLRTGFLSHVLHQRHLNTTTQEHPVSSPHPLHTQGYHTLLRLPPSTCDALMGLSPELTPARVRIAAYRLHAYGMRERQLEGLRGHPFQGFRRLV